jgi:hypothetical protein
MASIPKNTRKGDAQRFRDRIVELRRVPAAQLLENPKNWRRHSEEQTAALTSIMEKIGFAGAAIGVIQEDGSILLLDGHLRRSVANDQTIPVLITDLTEEEAKVFLATYDPLSELAVTDTAALKALLEDTPAVDEDAFLRKMMADVEAQLAEEIDKSDETPKDVDGMALEPHEHYDYLVVLAQTSNEWNVLCDRLGLKPEKRRARIGTARAIRATVLLSRLAKDT